MIDILQKFFLNAKPGGIGRLRICEAGEISKLLSVNLRGAVSFTRTQQKFKPSRKQVKRE